MMSMKVSSSSYFTVIATSTVWFNLTNFFKSKMTMELNVMWSSNNVGIHLSLFFTVNFTVIST